MRLRNIVISWTCVGLGLGVLAYWGSVHLKNAFFPRVNWEVVQPSSAPVILKSPVTDSNPVPVLVSPKQKTRIKTVRRVKAPARERFSDGDPVQTALSDYTLLFKEWKKLRAEIYSSELTASQVQRVSVLRDQYIEATDPISKELERADVGSERRGELVSQMLRLELTYVANVEKIVGPGVYQRLQMELSNFNDRMAPYVKTQARLNHVW